MKKTFYVLSCILAVAAMTLTGCKKDNDTDNNGGNGGNGGTNTTTVGGYEIDNNANVIHNGTGTLTVNGVEYALNIGHMYEMDFEGEQSADVALYDEYNTNTNRYGTCAVGLHFVSTLASTGDYVSGDDNGQVNISIETPNGLYEMPAFTFHFTRTGKTISFEMSANNVPGSNVMGQPIDNANISISYSGSVYYQSYGL